MLSLITASHQNPLGLQTLYAAVESQLGQKIEWIIKDSGQCPATRDWIASLTDPNIIAIVGPDHGIFDALNIAIGAAKGTFYLVIGSDDIVFTEAIRQVSLSIESGDFDRADVVTMPVRIGSRVVQRRTVWPLAISVAGLISSHSVGTLIRSSLHDRLGPYDSRYRILADSLFVRRAYALGARFLSVSFPVMGLFSRGGISGTAHSRRIMEAYSYNVECGSSPLLQTIFLAFRLAKYRPSTLL